MSATTAGTTRPRWPARRRIIIAALTISVALNLCLVAGALWSRANPPPATTTTVSERFRKLEATLHLNDQQRMAYHAYVAATLARSAQLRQQIEPLLDEAWAEIGKDQPDESLILQRLNDASSRWRGFQREGVDATLALLAKLEPDQRAKFIADERERRAAARRRRVEESR